MVHILIGDPILWTFKTFPLIVASIWLGQSNILPSLSREHKNQSWRTLSHLPEWLNLFTCCAVVCVFVKENSQALASVYTHSPRLQCSHFPPFPSLSAVLLSCLTFSLLSLIPSSKWFPSLVSQQCRLGTENPNPLHFNTVSYPLTYRLFAWAQRRASPSTQEHVCYLRAAVLSLLTSFPWTSAPSARRTQISSIPLDLKAFASHHEARNCSVTLLVCFKPQWEPCAHVLWDLSPPWKKLFLIPVKQHGMACASSEDLRDAFAFIICVKENGSDHVM